MTREEMKERYDYLYHKMKHSGEVSRMKVFGKAEKLAFERMLALSQEDAKIWLGMLESTEWNNYLTESEANAILGEMVSQDGKKGMEWDYHTLKDAVEGIGGQMTEKPYYNEYALWVMMNSIYSDHGKSIADFLDGENTVRFVYRMAVDKLKDVDRQRFIREYFGI